MTYSIDDEFSTRSGIFTAASSKISMRLDPTGQYEHVIDGALAADEIRMIEALDGLTHADEDALASDLYAEQPGVDYDSVLGYYQALFCGYVIEGDFRAAGTSGGMTTWVLAELLRTGDIDGVLAVVARDDGSPRFEYRVLRTIDDVRRAAKSRYYPVEMSSVLDVVRAEPGRYALVGIPSFVSDIRRLQTMDQTMRDRIVYAFSLLCGHQKSANYGEAIAFEAGFLPRDVEAIDFRFKASEGVSSGYLTEIVGVRAGKADREVRSARESFVGDWSAGMFKTSFSDFVDDCFGETADATFGDAWLPQYITDSRGTNVVVVRNSRIAELMHEGVASGRLQLDDVDVATVKASQAGLIRHYRDELPYRLTRFAMPGVKTRVQPSSELPILRRRVQDLRRKIAVDSHKYFLSALAVDDWSLFEARMAPLLKQYRMVYRMIRLQNLGVKGVIERLRVRRGFRRQAPK